MCGCADPSGSRESARRQCVWKLGGARHNGDILLDDVGPVLPLLPVAAYPDTRRSR